MLKNNPLFQWMIGLLFVFAALLSCLNSNSNCQIISTDFNYPQTMNSKNLQSAAEQNLKDLFPEPNKPPYFYVSKSDKWVKINDNWSIRIEEVLSDNRCPSGVGSCEESGIAEVKVQFQQPNVDYYSAYYETLLVRGLNRYPMPNGTLKPTLLVPITIDRKDAIIQKQIGFKITLVDLRPYPFQKFVTDVKKINYTGLFLIEKLK